MTLLVLLACGPSDDTGTTAAPVDLATLVPASAEVAWGCRWAYFAAQAGGNSFVADLVLPQADRYGNIDAHYARSLEPGERLEFGGGAGGDEMSVFDCVDVMDTQQGVRVWRATSASFEIDAVYVGERPDATCSGTGPNPVYDAQLTIVEAHFTDMDEVEATLSDWGPLEVEIGMDNCGG